MFDFAAGIVYNARMQANVNLNTVCKGDSLWSCQPGARVRVFKLGVIVNGDYPAHGELMAYFSDEDWNSFELGLIYTDRGWLRSFRMGLRKLGFSWAACMAVDYSEQGMQSHEYVSMDVGLAFIQEFRQHLKKPVDG